MALPQTATTETSCSKLVTFCTPSETKRKGESKVKSQLTHVLRWKYKNVNYLSTVLLQRNVLAERKAMPVQYLFNVTLKAIQSYLDMQKLIMPEDRESK